MHVIVELWDSGVIFGVTQGRVASVLRLLRNFYIDWSFRYDQILYHGLLFLALFSRVHLETHPVKEIAGFLSTFGRPKRQPQIRLLESPLFLDFHFYMAFILSLLHD